MSPFVWFFIGAVLSPSLILWVMVRRQKPKPKKPDPLILAKARFKIIADNTDEPRAAKIAEKTLKELE